MTCNNNDIFLRKLERNDALTSRHWRNDPDVWKYTGSSPDRYITEDIELQWIDRVLTDNTRRVFAICLEKNAQYIGNVQVTNIMNNEAHFHIFIGNKSFWGKGIGTAATTQMLKIAKDELHLSKLKLRVNPANTAARKIYLKVGFVPIDQEGNMEIIL